MKDKPKMYVYQCNLCHNMLQEEEELGECECGDEDWCCLDENCEGKLILRCISFQKCGCCILCEQENDEYYMNDDTEGMTEN